jgi:hypothetical protein
METIERHFQYIDHYERQIARERAKKRPHLGMIACAEGYIAHSRERIRVLNEAYAAEFWANYKN